MEECNHEYVYLDTDLKKTVGSYCNDYTRIDRFYCKKCLHEEEKTRTESSRSEPAWWHDKHTGSNTPA